VTVELGTYNGVCYTVVCQAVREQLETRCLAVDTWAGVAQASFYDETVYEDFRGFPDEHYAAFSTLLRCTFDVALLRFRDGSLDLLHFGGLHTYDAVCHDLEIWLPKISQHGVTLFHDINVRWSGFGVWQLWRELKEKSEASPTANWSGNQSQPSTLASIWQRLPPSGASTGLGRVPRSQSVRVHGTAPICRTAAEGPDSAGERVFRRGLRQFDPTSHLRNGRGAAAIGLRRRQVRM
jgi:hypothetical protein